MEDKKNFKVTDKRVKFGDEQEKPSNSAAKENIKSMEDVNKDEFGDRLPHIDFSSFIYSLAHTAFVHLGEEQDPFTGARDVNLHQAKETIDLLSIMDEKTKGNLTKEEEALMKNLLFNLRIKYVELAKKSPNK